MPKAAFSGYPGSIQSVYANGRRERLAGLIDAYPHILEQNTLAQHLPALKDLQVIFGTWGSVKLSPADLDQLPNLKAIFYAAGSVQYFAQPVLERGITVVSAWRANAIPVAEFTVSQILLAAKGYFQLASQCKNPAIYRGHKNWRGNYGAAVALLGAGAIGRLVIQLLKPFHLRVLVFDPFLSADAAAQMGVTKVTLEEAFAQGYVVSNHLANLPATVGMLRKDLFASMPPNATFINTGRGATVDEPGMIDILQARPDLTALLDVTHPEPPQEDSPLYRLPNVFLTPHIAGSLGDEVQRMADFIMEEFSRWQHGQPLQHAVSLEMLKTMA